MSSDRVTCTINLDALASNVEHLRRAAGQAQVWGVVKANAYGHGALDIARELERLGVPQLCVATLGEARQLRDADITTPILIMGPLTSPEIAQAGEHGFEVSILSAEMADDVASHADRAPVVHLKVNTGMGRWGVDAALAPTIATQLTSAGVVVRGVMTHFATADEADPAFLRAQQSRFEDAVAPLRAVIPDMIVHAANSAATMRGEPTAYDAVRCGIALYGLAPDQGDAAAQGLRPVMSLTSRVAAIRTLAPGESTGYGRRYIADVPTRIALVPIGYADGLPRLASQRGYALVRGARAPYAGTISMDHLSLRIADEVQVGDTVTLLGRDGDEHVTCEQLAHWAETINYEITCGIQGAPRITRVIASASERALC